MVRLDVMQSRLCLVLSFPVLLYAYWLGGHEHTVFSTFATGLVGIVAILSLAAFRFQLPKLKESLASFLLLVMAGMVVSNLVGLKWLAFDPFHDIRYAIFLSSLLVATATSLRLGWFVGRWLALALASAGIVSAGLNLVPYYLVRSAHTWTLALHVGGAMLIIANLIGSDVRERFEAKSSPLWTSQEPVLRSIRWTILSFFAAIPMLLVYAWMQPIVPATGGSALALAVFLALSIALTISKRVLGALFLVLGGLALCAQTLATLAWAHQASPQDGSIANYYAIFWLPAAFLAIWCGARMMAPLAALLRSTRSVD